ncbi:MAG: VanZ family protein [Verrucomicrobiota bacterium]|nr:VanZ family protein [Chthoniobacterales bacterium]MDQ3413888.1 VanZ family protein [Verrucomicrobiota bacterium]
MKIREITKAWLPVVLWMTIMFVGSTDLMSAEHTSRFLTPFLCWLNPTISPESIAQAHLIVRKAAHVTEYAILAGLLFRALRGPFGGFWPHAAFVFFPALLFAATDEWHQSFAQTRTASLGDVCIDGLGAIVGILVCRLGQLAWQRRSPPR